MLKRWYSNARRKFFNDEELINDKPGDAVPAHAVLDLDRRAFVGFLVALGVTTATRPRMTALANEAIAAAPLGVEPPAEHFGFWFDFADQPFCLGRVLATELPPSNEAAIYGRRSSFMPSARQFKVTLEVTRSEVIPRLREYFDRFAGDRFCDAQDYKRPARFRFGGQEIKLPVCMINEMSDVSLDLQQKAVITLTLLPDFWTVEQTAITEPDYEAV